MLIEAKKNPITGKVEESIKQKHLPKPLCPYCAKKLDITEHRFYGEQIVLIMCPYCFMVLGASFNFKKSND